MRPTSGCGGARTRPGLGGLPCPLSLPVSVTCVAVVDVCVTNTSFLRVPTTLGLRWRLGSAGTPQFSDLSGGLGVALGEF